MHLDEMGGIMPRRYEGIVVAISRVARHDGRPVRETAEVTGLNPFTVVVYRRILAARRSPEGLDQLRRGRGVWWSRARSLYARLERMQLASEPRYP